MEVTVRLVNVHLFVAGVRVPGESEKFYSNLYCFFNVGLLSPANRENVLLKPIVLLFFGFFFRFFYLLTEKTFHSNLYCFIMYLFIISFSISLYERKHF